MTRHTLFALAAVVTLIAVHAQPTWGRGFGGAPHGFGGGGAAMGHASFGGAGMARPDFGGGGMSGFQPHVSPGGFNPGGFNAGGFNPGGFNAGGFHPSGFNPGGLNPGGFNAGGFNPGSFNPGSFNPGGFNGGELESRLNSPGFGQGGFAGSGLSGDLPQRFSGLQGGGLNNFSGNFHPTNSGLSNFLGLPSDGGLHNLSGETQSRGSQIYDQLRAGEGPDHNFISGETQSPGSRLYDSIRSGNTPYSNIISGETQSRGSQIYDALRSGNQNIIHGETQSWGSKAYDYLRNNPIRPVSPWRIHNNAVIIRRNFNNYYFFTGPWYRRYPGAWYPYAWAYGSPWLYVPWPTLCVWMGYPAGSPVYYDYGSNVVYQNNSVYVNGQDAGTAAEYYQQAQTLAETGSDQQPGDQEQWMPLGVFALSQTDQTSTNMVIQLAVNKEGVIRGNFVDSVANKNEVVEGGVDKQTQRAAWIIGDNKNTVFDTGIYNLTKDETPVLVHFGDDKTEQWLMVRLDNKGQPQGQDASPGQDPSTAPADTNE